MYYTYIIFIYLCMYILHNISPYCIILLNSGMLKQRETEADQLTKLKNQEVRQCFVHMSTCVISCLFSNIYMYYIYFIFNFTP